MRLKTSFRGSETLWWDDDVVSGESTEESREFSDDMTSSTFWGSITRLLRQLSSICTKDQMGTEGSTTELHLFCTDQVWEALPAFWHHIFDDFSQITSNESDI
jgi:hypothetical protein